jgi:DNA-binding response OmpR family regulator
VLGLDLGADDYVTKPFSVHELLETVWGYDAPQTTRTVDNHIATLRAKLEPDPVNPRYLHTVNGVGYKLVLNRH